MTLGCSTSMATCGSGRRIASRVTTGATCRSIKKTLFFKSAIKMPVLDAVAHFRTRQRWRVRQLEEL